MHPLPTQPKNDDKVKTAKKSANTATNTPSGDTQELNDFIDEEEEFFNAVEHFEHDVGINDSMVEWFGVNFQSSFSNTGKFANITAPNFQPINCEDCKVNSKTFEKQREILMKQDTKLQNCYRLKKGNKNQIKELTLKLEEANKVRKDVGTFSGEITKLKVELQVEKDLVALKMKMKEKDTPEEGSRKVTNKHWGGTTDKKRK